MKVLHVDSEKSWRGGQQQVAYLIDQMQKEGLTPALAAQKGGELERKMRAKGVEVLSLSYALGDVRDIFKLMSFCAQKNIDLVHVHSSRAHSLAMLAAIFGNFPPLIVSKRTDYPIKKRGFSRWKYENKKIKKILCVSERIAHIVRESIDDRGRALAIHSGVDPKRFEIAKKDLRRELGLEPETILIGNSSALSDQKDQFTFLKTAKRILQTRPGARFVIFGEGDLSEEIKVFAKELGIENEVYFPGFRKDLPAVLPCLDIFLMTSKLEGLGTSLLDAMLCKLPIVSTRTGGIPEIVIEGKTGLLKEVGDAQGLAAQCERLLQDPGLAQELAQNAYEMAISKFNIKQTAAKTIEVYREALSNRQKAG